jgi:hypothetical protein
VPGFGPSGRPGVFAQPAGWIYPNEPMPVPVSWGKIFDDPMVAAAMLDRLLHRSVVFNIHGDSYRMRSHRARTEGLRKGVSKAKE